MSSSLVVVSGESHEEQLVCEVAEVAVTSALDLDALPPIEGDVIRLSGVVAEDSEDEGNIIPADIVFVNGRVNVVLVTEGHPSVRYGRDEIDSLLTDLHAHMMSLEDESVIIGRMLPGEGAVYIYGASKGTVLALLRFSRTQGCRLVPTERAKRQFLAILKLPFRRCSLEIGSSAVLRAYRLRRTADWKSARLVERDLATYLDVALSQPVVSRIRNVGLVAIIPSIGRRLSCVIKNAVS